MCIALATFCSQPRSPLLRPTSAAFQGFALLGWAQSRRLMLEPPLRTTRRDFLAVLRFSYSSLRKIYFATWFANGQQDFRQVSYHPLFFCLFGGKFFSSLATALFSLFMSFCWFPLGSS